MQSLILLRGLPGSGKSTLAHLLSENNKYPVFCIDDYFTHLNGEYKFIFDKNHLAYKQCEENCRKTIAKGAAKVFIDNVFSLEWEMEPYFKIASEFNCRIFVITVEKRHLNSNVHGVTNEQLKKMAQKYKVILL
ncbi:MAG: AAA family ATPase [Bacteroidetes bacterium]|nr:AAA family ATPase [Bacteroidota bacterium]